MTESVEHEQGAVEPEMEAAAAEATGHPRVDEVLASLAALDERPLDEHVSVFEEAHASLRAALTDAGTA